MSKLYYDIPLAEEWGYLGDADYQMKESDLPHFQQIAEWLPGEWNKCRIHTTFDGILKDKVQSCKMRCVQKEAGGHIQSIARVTITFVPGFRLTAKRRNECWEQLDGQLSDGFGESYDRSKIPGGNGWRLAL